MRTAFADEGDLRATDVLAALVTLWREGASGSLHCSRSGATAGFFLAGGELTSVTSSEARFETAAILLRAGKLDAATLERLSTTGRGDRALSALQAGVLTKREWRWGEKIRAVEVLSDLLTWIEGDYVFDRAARPEAGEFRLTVPRLVLELFLRSRDRALVLHYLGGADVPLERAPHFDSDFAAFGLTADAEAVVRLIDGKTTAAQIASEGPAEPFAVEKLLAALVTLGLVHPEFVGAEPPGAAPKAEDETEEPQEPDRAEWADGGEATVRIRDAVAGLDAASDPASRDLVDTEMDAASRDFSDEARHEEEGSLVEDHAMRDEDLGEPEIGSRGLRPGPGPRDDSPLEGASLDVARGGDSEKEAPLRKSVAASAHPGSEPAFDRSFNLSTGLGSGERPRARAFGPLWWLLGILVAGVAAVILLRGHGAAPTSAALAARPTPTGARATPATPLAVLAASPSATQPPAATPTVLVIRAGPTRGALPTARATARPPAPATPTVLVVRAGPTRGALPTARATARPPAPAATPRAANAPAEKIPGASRQAWLDRAARDHQRAGADRGARFTIQLELACEVASLVDAWKYDRKGTMWVVTTPFQGKTCFRVLWGRYPTRDAARRAISGVPAFFSNPRNRPVVTAIR